MLTKNGKLMMRVLRKGIANDVSANFSFREATNASSSLVSLNAETVNLMFEKVAVGSNNSALSTSDYMVNAVSGLTLISSNAAYASSYNDDYVATFSTTYKNNSSNVVTVEECGVYFKHDADANRIMLTRDLIHKELQPGESYTFTVTIG